MSDRRESRPVEPSPDGDAVPGPRKAGVRQVAATMFWCLVMIGKRGTWERDGAVITFWQAVTGAAIGAVVLVFVLVMLVRLATG